MNLAQFWGNPWHPEVGFSGTREGMTQAQVKGLLSLIPGLAPVSFHHGDCVGADSHAHELIRSGDRAIIIHTHPCYLFKYRACNVGDINHPTKPPLERNRDIVDASDIMLFTPKEPEPMLRSGTWATFRYSLSLGKHMVLIKPDGSLIFFKEGKEIKC